MKIIAGVDEVGIGALAGPVVAAVVILGPICVIDGITDSKKISGKKRESLATEIKDLALDWAIGLSSIEEIDSLNVLKASHLAMQRAMNDLIQKPSLVLVDGDKAPEFAFRKAMRLQLIFSPNLDTNSTLTSSTCLLYTSDAADE